MRSVILTCLVFLALLLMPFCGLSQTNGKVVYKVVLESQEFKQLEGNLLFYEHESFFFVDMQSRLNSIESDENVKLESENKINFNFNFGFERPTRFEVYINRKNGEILNQRSYFKDSKTTPCVVREEVGLFEWKIENETKKIGSFIAHKAKTNFRGRNYEAWFTPQIPLSLGPWKFHGLPGLILEIQDEDLGVQFLFSSIEVPYTGKENIKPPSEGEIISLNEFISYRDNFNQELIRSLKAKLPRDVSISSISINEVDRSIEREY